MTVLLVGADPMEFAGLMRRATEVTRPRLQVRWSRAGRVGGWKAVMVANGAGVRRAAMATDAALAGVGADAVVSTGFCGALEAEMEIADIVAGTEVSGSGHTYPVLSPACGRVHHTGRIVTIDHVAQTAAEKLRLRAGGGSAVEMEAAGVAERAQAHRLRFYCIRVVSDRAGEDMANDFNQALRDDGRFATMNILSGTLRKPLVRLPELLRLRRRCARAALALGEFIADCRF